MDTESEKTQLLADIDALSNQRATLLAELADLQIRIGQAKADRDVAIRDADIAAQATKSAVLDQVATQSAQIIKEATPVVA
jgi:DNA-directed RNA polymerase beta subunit